MTQQPQKQGTLSIHTENIFPIIKKWLYSEKDIFLRELISNAIDAMNKRTVMDPDVKKEDLTVRLAVDKKKKIITITDTGIGMTIDEIEKYINQIAFSGAEDFVEKYKDKSNDVIGHFGLGFYSSFMVSDKVTIDSLSYTENAEPAYWECKGDIEYQTKKGDKKDIGTTITLHVNEESTEYLEETKIRELVQKYCTFMPFPIYLNKEKEPLNLKEPLWNKKPKDVTDDEYKEFYKQLFHQFDDPLFWIHLNVDYPFNLKGILYFPKIKNDFDLQRGRIKLFCHNVFVADDLKGIIPEFLLLLRGGMDIPDIPLNVSRSFLQEDNQVKTISQYIIKKVADSLKSIYKDDRKHYEELWEDINHFIKFGLVSDDKFYDTMKDNIIYKCSTGDYVTLEEYRQLTQDEEKKNQFYYAADEYSQKSYVELLKNQGYTVLYCNSPIDMHLMQKMEMNNQGWSFTRVDSNIPDSLVQETNEVVDADNKTRSDKIKDLFIKKLDNKDITVETKSLKSKEIPGMVVFNEQMRRFQEMNSYMAIGQDSLLQAHTLVVNTESPIVQKMLTLEEKGQAEKVTLLCQYIHELALLEQKQMHGQALHEFLKKAQKVLEFI